VYVARGDGHLTVAADRTFRYHDGTRIRFVRSSANPLFESAARIFDGHVVAVVLSGSGSDATDGVQGVKAHGGLVIAQDAATSEHWDMPRSAIRSGAVDYVLPLDAIGTALADIVHGRPVSSAT
jgi:two-component system chemotaxis response regulator CheB